MTVKPIAPDHTIEGEEEEVVDRLAASRVRLRNAMLGISPVTSHISRNTDAAAQHTSRPPESSPSEKSQYPLVIVVIQVLRDWWQSHPLRISLLVATDAANVMLQPVARRHPFRIVLASFSMGGLFAWSRPWRWIFKVLRLAKPAAPLIISGLLPQIVYAVMNHQSFQSWLQALISSSHVTDHTTTPPQAQAKSSLNSSRKR